MTPRLFSSIAPVLLLRSATRGWHSSVRKCTAIPRYRYSSSRSKPVTVAVVPASFDPIQLGHVDIITRTARLFDRVVVAVYARPRKSVMFSLEERVELVRQSIAGLE